MRKQTKLVLILAGVGVLWYMRKQAQAKAAAVAAAAAAAGAQGPSIPALPVYQDEWAGSELYQQTGTVLPSGAARDLIR